MTKIFEDVQIKIELSEDFLAWPESHEVEDESHPGDNHDYADYRWVTRRDAHGALTAEAEILAELAAGNDSEEAAGELWDRMYDGCDVELLGLDLGMGATVFVLASAGCIPVASCNGGAFGGFHHEAYPLVVFYAKPHHVGILKNAANESGAGLSVDEGLVQVYAREVRHLHHFASVLYDGSKRSKCSSNDEKSGL